MSMDSYSEEQAEREERVAAQTVVVTKFWYYHPSERKAKAREALRHLANCESYKKEDGMADVFLEGLWNIMSGNNED